MARRDDPGMRWHPSREQSWVLFAVGGALAVVAVLVDRWSGPSWLLLLLAVTGAVGGLLLTRFQAAAQQRDQRTAVLTDATRTVDEDGRQERVRDIGLPRFGVHRAHIEVDYIHRAAEAELLSLLDAGAAVLVVGHSMAGKTRMSAQVLREHFGDRPILLPAPPDGLSQLVAGGAQPQGTVVWLDDLDRYLTGAGIRVEWLDRMRRRGNLVVATMRASEHARYQPDSQVRPPQAELLERFEVLRLDPDDAREREQLATQVQDPYLRTGITRYGLAEYVGGGYLAVQRYENARTAPHPKGHPLGVAMVRAAVDWRRVGLDVIPATSLAALAPMYLPERYRYDPGEDTATATAWATELVDTTMRLLEPADEHGGTRAFDYILDYLSTRNLGADDVDSVSSVADVPEHTWREAVSTAPVERRMDLAYNAYDSGRTDHAKTLWQRAAADPDQPGEVPEAAFNLGVLLADQGQPEEAAAAFQQAIDSGHPDHAPEAAYALGFLLVDQDQPGPAELAFRQAIDSGHPDHAPQAARSLGALLAGQGQPERAELAFRQAVDSGHPDHAPQAAVDLGFLLADQGRPEQAELAFRQAVDSGHPDHAPVAAYDLGVLLADQGRPEQAAAAYQEAIDSGHPDHAPEAAYALGFLLAGQGRSEQAAAAYQEAIDSGHPDHAPRAAVDLGFLLAAQGRLEQAAAAYRQAIDSGHPDHAPEAAYALGVLLADQGRPERAAAEESPLPPGQEG